MDKKSTLKTGVVFVVSFFLTIFVLLPQVVNAVTQEWVRRYDGPGKGYDQASAIALDNSGNVYVTGYSRNKTGNSDYTTIKYSGTGKQLWVRRYDGPGKRDDRANAIAVDIKGNVYVTGQSEGGTSNDFATIKYNSAGKQLWVRIYDGPGKGYDEASAIALDNSGNVYVTGASTTNTAGNIDYATIKYNSDGKQLWVRKYDGPPKFSDGASAIAVDIKGNVYVTGNSTNKAGNSDYATIKYNSAGKQLWVRRHDGPGKRNDSATAIAVDIKGNVYVTGNSTNKAGNSDYATIKYNSAGKQLWVRRYDGPVNWWGYSTQDYAWGMAVDNKGNAYVTGASGGDFATIKYNSVGKQLWARRYDGPGKWATAIAVDIKGNVYVTGHSTNKDVNSDYATIKYNSAGKQLWVKRYDGPGKRDDRANAIAVDSIGNVYVTGYSTNKAGNWDYVTIKYAP